MSILKRIFGDNAKTENAVSMITPTAGLVESNPLNVPPFELFIDNEAPQKERPVFVEPKSEISNFLDQNYLSMGNNDGFEYHSNETLEIGKKKIRAKFQLIMDKMIQTKNENRLQLNIMKINVEHIAEETKRRLELTIEEINSSISLLEKQKELSAENEGWVMNAIHTYHQGFIQGLNDYMDSENLLISIKNF